MDNDIGQETFDKRISSWDNICILDPPPFRTDTTQLLLLGKFEYTGGPIFKVVLEC